MALSMQTRTLGQARTASASRFLAPKPAFSRRVVMVRAEDKKQVITAVNGDPYVGFLETPVTSAPIVASFLSALPAYRTGVSPLQRGVEIGLAHGYLLSGPFIKLGPYRNVEGSAEVIGSLAAAGLVLILAVCLSVYGAASFQGKSPAIGVKTLTGRAIARDPLQTDEGWSNFSAGFTVGGLSGVAWSYILTQVLPYYS